MVSIIKNQLLKHLSRFTKNLSADKINLSTFKGEGELSNLELDEIVLTELLELPSWLRLTRAWCNRVQFRIHWTKLKTVPIYLKLDEVNIIVETCEELRSLSSPSGASSYGGVPGKYSFIHKVIDGITIAVNTVNITFNSPAFTASVQISRIIVESKSTSWQRSDLRMTRLKDTDKGQILIFKELEWQTVRIEAKSTKDKELTPLRLLTNHARCRITIKKRLSDCFIMGSRLVLILDDLLWVLTDSQMKAALHFLDSLADLVQKATDVTRKEKAARKLEVLPEYQAQKAQEARSNEASAISKIFSRYDVVETSYHFLSQHIVLHLCDDPGDSRSCHPNLKDGGALQISLHGFQVDYYPYHLAMGDRKHWPRYKDGSVPHTQWLNQSLSSFRSKFIDLIDKNRSQHVPLSRSSQAQNQTNNTKPLDNHSSSMQSGVSPDSAKKSSNTVKNYVLKQLPKMMTTCIIVRIEDFSLYKVTTSGKKQALKEFISGDRDHISLPEDTNIFHAEFTYYYYPGNIPFPLPPPKFYVQLNPTQIYFDIDSCLWMNSFALNLHQSLVGAKSNASSAPLPYIDVKIEAILPRVILESNIDQHGQRDRPKSLHLQVTRATITNVRSLEQSSRADLAKCVDSFHMGSLFFGSDFPSQPNDYYIVTQKFLDHIAAMDNVRSVPEFIPSKPCSEQFTQELLWTEAKDVWCINLDPVWADFYGARSVGSNRPIPFLDAVPVTIWVHMNMDMQPKCSFDEPKTADIHALAYISNLVSVQLNHYQYLFLLRMAEDLSELATFLTVDSNRILKQDVDKSLAIGALIPQVEVTFVMPSQCPGKESSGGDLESVLPDSSSIADDILAATGSGATLWQPSETLSSQTDLGKKSANVEPIRVRPEMGLAITSPINESMTRSTPKATDGAAGMKNTPQSQPFSNIPNNLNAGLSSMKKGFSNLMTSIDSALKSSPDDMSDTVSIRSDASSDSENYVVVNLESGERNVECMDAMFKVQGVNYDVPPRAAVVEMASEVIEDENTVTTPSEHSLASTYKRRDLVSVATFKLSKVEFLQQSAGFASNLKVQVSNIVSDECGSIPWDEFQSKFSSRSRAWVDLPANSNTSLSVKLRLDHDLDLSSLSAIKDMNMSDKTGLRKLFKDTLNIQVNDVDLILNMSTVIGLADLVEDEIIPIQIPMQISLNNIQLHLNEDRPPNNITSPGPIPIDLKVNQLFINKDVDGVFHIMPLTQNSISSTSSSMSLREEKERERELQTMQQTIRQLKSDNDELKRRLAAFDRISDENRVLRKTKEESEILRACLTSAQDDIAKLINDKKSLLESLQKMEEHFKQPDRSRQWTTKR
ncbi:uncharacterized protein CBL_01450 [Carabus blaptoides fortunei]